MFLTPYAELIALSAEDKSKKLVPCRVKSQRMKAELAIAKLEEGIAALEGGIAEKCAVFELDIHAIGEGLDELALAERKLAQFKDIVGQLFPAAPAEYPGLVTAIPR